MSLTKVTSQMIDDDGVYGSPQGYVSNSAYLTATAANATGEQFSDYGAKIARIVDRLFVGGAATQLAGTEQPDTGTSWMGDNSQGPAYLLTNATLAVYPETCRYGIVAAANTSLSAGAGSAIALGAIIVNSGSLPGWGAIIEAQHTSTTDLTFGLELAIKNASGINTIINAVNTVPPNATIGILMAGGGDDVLGPLATNPSSAGIVFSTGNTKGWNAGIVFRAGALPTNEAISFAKDNAMNWYESTSGTIAGFITCNNPTAAQKMGITIQSNGVNFTNGSNASAFFVATETPNSVNRLQVSCTDTGVAPALQSGGSDTDIDISFIPKGAGLLRFGTFTGSGDVACNGYITVKDFAGNTRKLMTTA